ncbi:UNVERIFIED_CONTAM: hypothetical protein Slati_1330400 [Sesamum latifolium]|uniref:Reverse transcriptase domain-containing protein n=1 Tax=Sesamum latifolium TaxID=2727402 RepID=A0AAW2XHQ2_9LAMI
MKSDRYCHFHKGHTTEECLHLKDEIEKLIRKGYLKEYVDRNNRAREGNSRPPREGCEREARQNQPNQDNPPTAGVIGVISGGPAGGDLLGQEKRHSDPLTTLHMNHSAQK